MKPGRWMGRGGENQEGGWGVGVEAWKLDEAWG